ncbi:MAG: DEAD/DEAH box helicase [Alphaproteobacteria bacterium]|nr:DEAD/DEAH box helicase [Alphaproteobacteria bacterium]
MLKLLKYTEDDAWLRDPSDAEFVRRKIKGETVLDFSGVAGVTAPFLDALLEGHTAESIGERLEGMNDAVDNALASWIDRSSAPVKPIEKAKKPRRVRVTKPKPVPATPAVEREPITDDRFTPTRLVQRLGDSLRGYIESAYPLSDPTLVRARRHLLETEAGGHLLSQEPFIETTTRYASSPQGYDQLGLPDHLGRFFAHLAATPTQASTPDDERRILYPSMYGHQERAFTSFLVEGRDIVVATGTGSGKTECFLVPLLGSLYYEAHARPASFQRPGVRALILYPMNALVNDQLSRLRLLFGEPAVADQFAQLEAGRFPRFGMYTGRTPYPGPRKAGKDGDRVAPLLEYYLGMDKALEQRLRELGRYPAKDLRAFFAKNEERRAIYQSGKKKGKEYTRHNWDRRLHTSPGDRELLTRHEMVHGVGTKPGHSPDILVTNYSMLEYMLMRPFERPIFAETRRWLAQEGAQLLLVLDEAHMYRGAKGAEVAFLLRRLRARLGIHDQPHKLRVIATSASLGTDEDALSNIKRFAADLCGKQPDDFAAITGTREVPEPAAPATPDEAEVLASVDLEALHAPETLEDFRKCLRPVLEFYGVAVPESVDDGVLLAQLHAALAGRPVVNQLVLKAAGDARALSDLADEVFPGHAKRRQALHALLALGTLARRKPDAPGLVPTRVHGMFRGLHGLYGCVNPCCSGRQDRPGEEAVLGKLFSYPRATCDDCGARVFELSSCRSCGTPYVLAYAESGTLDTLEFLWGETEGHLVRFELLPIAPRYPDRTEELRVHLKTGYLDPEVRYPDDEVRSLFMWVDGDDRRQPNFDRCAMCQPERGNSRIFDFRTRGEQAFTALIEAQFSEQAPQKLEATLPNHGRKVLVFSDGRQKAARLAPALEHSHARDLFRQVIALAADELREQEGLTGMHWLYPGVAWLCGNRGYDLFPSAEEVEFHNHLRRVHGKTLKQAVQLANRGGLRPTKSFAQALFSELTDRYYSLPALALGTIEEDPDLDHIFDDFPAVGLEDDAIRVLFRSWVRLHLERRSFRPDGAELRDLGEGWANPTGINAERMNHVLPNRFEAYVATVLEDDSDAVEAVGEWFKKLVRNSELLDFEGDRYYLRPLGLSLNLRLDASWLRCVDCGRIHPESLQDTCPGCCGGLVEADPAYLDARTGFYRDHVLRAFEPSALEPFGLSAAEHSAQLTGNADESAFNKVEEYELRFQDIPLDGKPPIDVLSCTTTMEVGIDIGALSGVALRNVPPHVANYQQRAGRAGRRGRSIASVVTYAHGTSHDAHFFEHPAAIISGDVRAPIVYVENQQVLERHIHAYLVQRFFHEKVPTDTGSSAYMLFESLGTVEQFLSEAHPCSLERLEEWLTANEAALRDEIRHWAPTYSYGLDEPIPAVDETIDTAVTRLMDHLREVLPIEEYAKRDELEGLEREALERRLEDELLQTLIGRAVFPRYAFPTDVVAFWVSKPRQSGDPTGRRKFDYEPQRDLQLALTEYAPGRSLTIDKWRFESAALFSPYEPTPEPTLARRQPYTACRACSFVSLEPAAAAMTLCPVCGSDQVVHSEFITPAGFAPDINAKREVDRGQAITYAGMTDRARLEVQDPPDEWDRQACDGRLRVWTGPRMLAVVNKGVGERGFRVCPDCGRSEPEYGPGYTRTTLTKGGNPVQHKHPMEKGAICVGVAQGPYYMGHRFPTDALLLRLRVQSPLQLGTPTTPGLLSRASRMALTSLVEAIALAASRELQIDEGELAGWWAPVLGGKTDEAQLYLYDLLPGGAGYARAVGDALEQVLEATEKLLAGCDCASSCYRCIRHYGNNWIHASLDRHLALALLRHVRTGAVPEVSPEAKTTSLTGLREYLGLRGISVVEGALADGVTVPMQFEAATGAIWLDVHHPLIDPARAMSEVASAAQMAFQELVEVDAFTLVHDLPEAVRRLQLPDVVAK